MNGEGRLAHAPLVWSLVVLTGIFAFWYVGNNAAAGDLGETPTSESATTTTSTASASGVFPTISSVGVPPEWTPVQTINGDYVVSEAGAVVEDLRINGSLQINAPNVTVRRVEIIDGIVYNVHEGTCQNGLVIEDSTIRHTASVPQDYPAFGVGGYTARGVLIDGVPEGFRVGGAQSAGCGPVVIEDSYSRTVFSDPCIDWHGDSLQGYDGPALTMRNSVLELVESPNCGGTAPFWYPAGAGNTSVDIDGLIVIGGGYPFRLGMPGVVARLQIVNGSWAYGPLDVDCSLVVSWDAWIVSLEEGQPIPIRRQPCDT